jgi:methionine-S-sulfoxide reductase
MSQDVKGEVATLGGGCFWCLEAVFDKLKGVSRVESGYAGGTAVNPTYRQVCTGTTGHAEVVQITFDPALISYREVLEVFFDVHDPTTLNRQGADVGTQYRSGGSRLSSRRLCRLRCSTKRRIIIRSTTVRTSSSRIVARSSRPNWRNLNSITLPG